MNVTTPPQKNKIKKIKSKSKKPSYHHSKQTRAFFILSVSLLSLFLFSFLKAVSGKVNRKHSLQAKIKKDDVSKET